MKSAMSWIVRALFAAALVTNCAGAALARGTLPEDLLKGRILISDRRFPTHWNSAASYAAQLKAMSRGTLWYDKKTGKVKIEYAAFFAQPVNDVQVDIVIYDVTNGAHERKASNEQFMTRGERVLFNSITLDKEDYEMNRKYRFVIESRHKPIATGEVILRGEGPHYSGRVTFTDEDAKQKD